MARIVTSGKSEGAAAHPPDTEQLRETRLTMDEITAYLPGLSPVENKELCVRFAGGRLSSDGGVLVLREIEKRLGLAARLAGCLSMRAIQRAPPTHTPT